MFTSDAAETIVREYHAKNGDEDTARWLWLLGTPVQLITRTLRDQLGCKAPAKSIAKWCRDADSDVTRPIRRSSVSLPSEIE